MDELDRKILNRLQGGFPICDRPFAEAARQVGTTEQALIERIRRMLEDGVLTRFGPLFQAERLGGALSLAAMKVPPQKFDEVAEKVNSYCEVAHNYERDHDLNMWFVLATEDQRELSRVLHQIEQDTGCRVYNLPKLDEYFVGLHFSV